MSSLEKPSRRALVAWGLASAGLPFVSQVLVPVADGQVKPNELGARAGQNRPGATRAFRYFIGTNGSARRG